MISIRESIYNYNFFPHFFESEKYCLPHFIPVGIGIGISLYFSLDNEPNFYLNLLTFGIVTAISIFAYLKSEYLSDAHAFALKCMSIAFFTVSLGFLISQIRTNTVSTFMLKEDIKKPISFVAKVESCEKTEKGLKFLVSNPKRKYNDDKNNLCKKFSKLHLTWIGNKARNAKEDYLPGSEVLFRTILSPIYPQSFPGAYDFRKQQYFKGISARGFIIKAPKIIAKANISSLRIYIEQLRHIINKKIESYLSKGTAAIAEALITGNTSGITKTVRANFANSGIAHILAISGLHMGIIGFFIFWISRILLCCFSRISMFYDIKKIAACISWVVTLFYLYLSGCAVSSVRSFIMHTLIMVAILLNKTALTMRSVAIAATAIMLYNPEVILFPSFQLSFGAVIGIVAFYECGFKLPKFMNGLTEIIATTLIASIPTSIISIFIFNQLTLNSVLANIICIPLMGFFIMPLAVIAMFMMIFDMSQPFVWLMGLGVNFLIKVAEEASKLPGSFFVMHSPTNFVYAIMILSGLWLTLIRHKIRCIGFVGIAVGVISYFNQSLPDIFVSRHAKVVGIKVNNIAHFSHLGYFRSITDSWTKAVGIARKDSYKSKASQEYISKIDNDTYMANVKGKKIVVTKSDEFKCDGSEFLVFHINKEKNKFAELIYLDSNEKLSNELIKRPWS